MNKGFQDDNPGNVPAAFSAALGAQMFFPDCTMGLSHGSHKHPSRHIYKIAIFIPVPPPFGKKLTQTEKGVGGGLGRLSGRDDISTLSGKIIKT